jgi:hypothetical protein
MDRAASLATSIRALRTIHIAEQVVGRVEVEDEVAGDPALAIPLVERRQGLLIDFGRGCGILVRRYPNNRPVGCYLVSRPSN